MTRTSKFFHITKQGFESILIFTLIRIKLFDIIRLFHYIKHSMEPIVLKTNCWCQMNFQQNIVQFSSTRLYQLEHLVFLKRVRRVYRLTLNIIKYILTWRCVLYRNRSFVLLGKIDDSFLYKMKHWAKSPNLNPKRQVILSKNTLKENVWRKYLKKLNLSS